MTDWLKEAAQPDEETAEPEWDLAEQPGRLPPVQKPKTCDMPAADHETLRLRKFDEGDRKVEGIVPPAAEPSEGAGTGKLPETGAEEGSAMEIARLKWESAAWPKEVPIARNLKAEGEMPAAAGAKSLTEILEREGTAAGTSRLLESMSRKTPYSEGNSGLNSLFRQVEAAWLAERAGETAAAIPREPDQPERVFSGLTVRELDREVCRDSRCYDGGMNIF